MANPFDDPSDYGTLTGQSTGFRTRSGGDFNALRQSVADAVLEINQNNLQRDWSAKTLRQLYNQIGETSDNENTRRRIVVFVSSSARLLNNSLPKVETARSGLSELFQITRGSPDKGEELAVKSVHQSVQKSVDEFNRISESILGKLQEYPEPPRSGPSPGYLDSGEAVEVEGESARLIPSSTTQQQQQQQDFHRTEEVAHVEDNAERMEELQQNIVTLHGIMGDIVQMAMIQGETVDQISHHVETAAADVDHGTQQLGKAKKYKKCSRKLTCCIIITLIILLLIIVAIILAAVLPNQHKSN